MRRLFWNLGKKIYSFKWVSLVISGRKTSGTLWPNLKIIMRLNDRNMRLNNFRHLLLWIPTTCQMTLPSKNCEFLNLQFLIWSLFFRLGRTYLTLNMMKYANSLRAQHSCKQPRCEGQMPAWKISDRIHTVCSIYIFVQVV